MTNGLGLAGTIAVLRAEGYAEDFNLSPSEFNEQEGILRVEEDDFVVDQVYRFDVMSDPDDQSVLYAISSAKSGRKGIIVNSFGLYTEPAANQRIAAIHRWGTDRK